MLDIQLSFALIEVQEMQMYVRVVKILGMALGMGMEMGGQWKPIPRRREYNLNYLLCLCVKLSRWGPVH